MPKTNGKCLRCEGKMEDGFLLDEGHGRRWSLRWVAGLPVRAFFTGVKVRDKRRHRVEADRCCDCGWLDLYAIKRDF